MLQKLGMHSTNNKPFIPIKRISICALLSHYWKNMPDLVLVKCQMSSAQALTEDVKTLHKGWPKTILIRTHPLHLKSINNFTHSNRTNKRRRQKLDSFINPCSVFVNEKFISKNITIVQNIYIAGTYL